MNILYIVYKNITYNMNNISLYIYNRRGTIIQNQCEHLGINKVCTFKTYIYIILYIFIYIYIYYIYYIYICIIYTQFYHKK